MLPRESFPENCTVKWSSQAAHLVNFLGTDTVAALLCTKKYYHAKMLGILRIGRQKEFQKKDIGGSSAGKLREFSQKKPCWLSGKWCICFNDWHDSFCSRISRTSKYHSTILLNMTSCSVQINFCLFAKKNTIVEFKRHGKFHHLMISYPSWTGPTSSEPTHVVILGCHSAEESSWPLHPGFRAFYNYILGSRWRGGRNDQHAAFLSNWISGLRISARKKTCTPNQATLNFRWYVSASNVFRLHHRMIIFRLAILLMSSRHARTAKIRKNARFWWFDLLILIRWIGGWCGWWWNPLEGLLGRQVEGYDQRFTTQMMTPRGKGLHKWNSKIWTIEIIPSTSTATYKLEGSQVCERNLAKRQEVTWYQYHFVKTFFGDEKHNRSYHWW